MQCILLSINTVYEVQDHILRVSVSSASLKLCHHFVNRSLYKFLEPDVCNLVMTFQGFEL
jgi:hypothetical protein